MAGSAKCLVLHKSQGIEGMKMAQQFWEKSYPPGITWDETLPEPSRVESVLDASAAQYADRIAIDFYDSELTFSELRELAARTAKGLQALGVAPGIQVGVHLPNTPHFAVAFFGILMAGGTVVTFSPFAAARELQRQIADSEVRVVFTLGLPMLYPQMAALKGTAMLETLIVCAVEDFLPPMAAKAFGASAERMPGKGREKDFNELIDNDGLFLAHPHSPPQEELAALQYTGGTTGEPKGAMLTHANFSAVVEICSRWTAASSDGGPEAVLVLLPLFHIFGLSMAMLVNVALGNKIVLHIRFDADRVLSDISKKKITGFGGVPTMYGALVNHPRVREFDLSSLRLCAVGGAPMPLEILSRFQELTGLTPREGYGLTETAPLATMQRLDDESHPGAVGLPAPHTMIEVVDLETGLNVMPIGEPGEICISGPQVMKGYWKRPEETREALRGGRLHTGDIGVLDADGYLTLIDRKKDMIINGGFNVFPRKIEEAIYEHPSVGEVTVIGVPDPDFGQFPKAFIALKPNASALGYDELAAFLADKLAPYEVPLDMEIRSSLPKNPAGKLTKKELLDEELAKRKAI
jgi:long-chain acyl-CoA synthetase